RQCPSLESVVLPKGLKKLKKGLFNQCKVLKSIVIPESVTEIEEEVFDLCQALERVELPEAITIIKERTFCVCESLKEIILPSGITKIEKNAFLACYSLVSVVIPKGVKEIGKDAFTSCNALKNIFYAGTEAEWKEIAIETESDYADIPEALLGWQNATRYYYSESEPPLSEDGTAYDGNYWYYDENGVPMVWTKEENGAAT
ncbi:MAG: leucine-rich repeat domain-containing protein, partial [Clostridia bacterium]|nr:leucine-rich repeat domain-containing protein [Clostridia bacterium]